VVGIANFRRFLYLAEEVLRLGAADQDTVMSIAAHEGKAAGLKFLEDMVTELFF